MAKKEQSAFDRLGHYFNIANQWAKEKIGSAQASPESPEFIETRKRFRSNEEELSTLHKKMEKLLAATIAYNDAFDTTQDAIATFATHQNTEDACGKQVQAFVTAENTLHRAKIKVQEVFRRLLIRPVDALLKEEVTEAVDLEKKYDLLHLAYDACRAKHEEAKRSSTAVDRVNQAKQDEAELKEEFDKMKDEFVKKCIAVDRKKNAILSHNLRYYMQAEVNFYADGYRAFPPDSLPEDVKDNEGAK